MKGEGRKVQMNKGVRGGEGVMGDEAQESSRWMM